MLRNMDVKFKNIFVPNEHHEGHEDNTENPAKRSRSLGTEDANL